MGFLSITRSRLEGILATLFPKRRTIAPRKLHKKKFKTPHPRPSNQNLPEVDFMDLKARIITVAQQKGGSGKTTIAAQLAVGLAQEGYSVATVDIDPQGSLSLWYEKRKRALGSENTITHSRVSGWRLSNELSRMGSEADYIIIDSPPHTETDSTTAIRVADLVLLPLQPSPLDLWACRPTIGKALEERKDFMIVINRVPARSKLNDTIDERLEQLRVPISSAVIGNRVSYVSSIMEGQGVLETDPKSQAGDEMRALVKDVKEHKAFTGKKLEWDVA